MKCPKCHQIIDKSSKFCQYCGTKQKKKFSTKELVIYIVLSLIIISTLVYNIELLQEFNQNQPKTNKEIFDKTDIRYRM